MHTHHIDVQALKNPTPRNASYEIVARTMTSSRIVELGEI